VWLGLMRRAYAAGQTDAVPGHVIVPAGEYERLTEVVEAAREWYVAASDGDLPVGPDRWSGRLVRAAQALDTEPQKEQQTGGGQP
jgi:hypothetical protein